MDQKACRTKNITAVTYAYLVLPFLIFAVGWMKPYLGLPIAAAVLFCAWRAWKETPETWMPSLSRDNVIKILFICAIVFIWVFYSGIGGKVFQNTDHEYRNSIFEALVNHSWPVYNRAITAPQLYPEGTTLTALVYYIGFWLPSAVVGKLFGLQAGYNFQMLWAFLGIMLVYYYMCERKKTLAVWPLALLIFFSGLDIIGIYLMGTNIFTVDNSLHLEWWVGGYQYTAMTAQLFWVFNQAVPAWLCTIFVMRHPNNRSIVFVIATVMLNSTFPFLGLLVFAAFWMLSRKYKLPKTKFPGEQLTHWLTAFRKDTFTIQNVLGGGLIGISTFLYLRCNAAATGIAAQGVGDRLSRIVWPFYFVFVLVEVGAYLILTYKYQNHKGVYLVTALSLILIPLLKGSSYDFCMRVPIPAQLVLLLLIQDTLEESRLKKDRFIFWGLIAALTIGSVTPIHEFARSVGKTAECRKNGTPFCQTRTWDETLNGRNFSGSAEHGFFFKYMAKEPGDNE